MSSRSLLITVALVASLVAGGSAQQAHPSEFIDDNLLRGHLSFIASDALQGRATPSKGLDMAAEYIAAQFRTAGLEEVNDSYFQLAPAHRLNREGMPVLKNVVGILRGTDPVLKDTYLLVTAHYDHIGMNPNAPGDDKIFNGANDDGSGTVGVIAIAQALGRSKVRPKRSVLFMCVFGEELGMHGTTFYGANPLVPLTKTVAMLNIEMIGRTNKESASPAKRGQLEDWTGKLGVTGYDYSDVGTRLTASGKNAGINVVFDTEASGPFFRRSDNVAIARLGIPAHTVSVGYEDPEYHQANDHWQTIDYPNMAKVVRALVYATLDLANDPTAPKWADIPATQAYRDAYAKLHGG